MKSLMTFVGILAFNLPNISIASDFLCPVNANVSNFTCSGTVKVKTLAELNAYRNDLGVVVKKPTVAKNLQIDFNPALTSDLVISTPCLIKIPKDIVMTSTANICLHGTKGVSIDENFKFTGKNLKLESKEEVIINKNSVIKALDIKLLSIGSGDTSKTYIRDGANIEAANLSIESFDKGFIGKNSIVKLTGALGIYSLGDDEASVREGARVEAAKIEISSTEETRVAKLTSLVASEIILNGIKCTINKTAVITADDRLGNCFLTSTTNKAKFSINKNQGTNPLTVNFNASSIADAKGFVWSFGDGETLNSLTPNVTHIYNRVGSFTATLKYATKDNYKGLKSAGAIQIDVREAPISNPVIPVPPRGNLKYQADGTFVYLRGYIRKGTHDIANAYYVIDDNQNNKIQIPNFYQNSLTSVDMNTYGRHKVTMTVIDVQGLTHSKSMNVYTDEDESAVYPYMRLDYDQSAARTIFFDLSWSFNPIAGETLKNFKIDFGDGQSAVLTDSAFITHTYAQAGAYLVRGRGSVNGNEDFDEYEIEVTDENTPIMNPIAGFEYQIYNSAGNVVFTDDRSGTPNGEIISYAWDFGDGTVGYGRNALNFYAPGDYLVTLTVTDTAGLRSSQTQKITIVAEGDDIASMLDCKSDGNKNLSCDVVAFDKFNEITRVKLDWGDGSSENLIIPDIVSTGFSIREHRYQNYGTYNVKLTIDTARGNTKNLSHEIAYIGSPVAAIQCFVDGLIVTCNTSGTSDPQNSSLEYTYSFGDGVEVNSLDNSITHSYATPGGYEVKLTVKNIYGKTSDAYTWAQINNTVPTYPPVAHVQCTINNLLVMCNALASYDPAGSLLEYSFIFEPDSIVNNLSGVASYAYSSGGLHLVKVKIRNQAGLEAYGSTWVQTFEVPLNQDPQGDIFCENPRPYTLSCFPRDAGDVDGHIVSFEYFYDDNYSDIKSDANPSSHTFVNSGEKTVKLVITDNDGGQTVRTRSFMVMGSTPPVIDSISCTSSKPQEVSCFSLTHDPDVNDTIINYSWDLGDGNVVDGLLSTITNYLYTFPGQKNIILTVTDQYGLKTSHAVDVLIKANLPPIANFNCYSNFNYIIECSSFSLDTDGIISKTSWHIDDGTVIEGSMMSYSFPDDRSHTIRLVVVDDLGAVSEFSSVLNNLYNIIPTFDVESGLSEGELPFEADIRIFNAKDIDGNIVSYEWGYKNNIIGTTKELKYTFTDAGKHDVYVRVKDDRGGVAEKIITIAASDRPTAVITSDIDSGGLPLDVNLSAEDSHDSYGDISTYAWFIAGKKVSEEKNLNYQFDDVEENIVELRVTNIYGVSSSVIKIIDIQKSSLYLNIEKEVNAYRGSVLTVPFSVDKNELISDIQFALINAPEGMIVDEENKQLIWEVGNYPGDSLSFKVSVLSSSSSFVRNVKINILTKKLIRSINIGSNNPQTYEIQENDSILNGAKIIFGNGKPRVANIYESKLGEESLVSIDTGTPEPVKIIFAKETVVDNSNSYKFHSGSNWSMWSGFSFVLEKFGCWLDPVKLGGVGMREYAKRVGITYNKFPLDKTEFLNNIFISSYVNNESKNLIIDALKGVDSSAAGYGTKNIYFNLVARGDDGETEGVTYAYDLDSFFIDLPTNWKPTLSSREAKIAHIRSTILHELFHTRQNQLSSCRLVTPQILSAIKFKNDSFLKLIESSADYFGMINVNSADRLYLLRNEYPNSDSLPKNLSSLPREGVLAKGDDNYRSRIIWDTYLSNYGYNLENLFVFMSDYPFLFMADGNKVLKDYAISKNSNIEKFLFQISSDLLASGVGAYTPLLYDLKNPLNFPVWNAENYYSRALAPRLSLETGRPKPGDEEFPPLSAKRFYINNFKNLKELNYGEGVTSNIFIKITTSSDNIKIRVLMSNGEDGRELDVRENYDLRKVEDGFIIGMKNTNDHGSMLDIINSGLADEKVTIKVQSNKIHQYFDLESAPNILGSPTGILLQCDTVCSDAGDFSLLPFLKVFRYSTNASGKKRLYRADVGRFLFITEVKNRLTDVNEIGCSVSTVAGSIERADGNW